MRKDRDRVATNARRCVSQGFVECWPHTAGGHDPQVQSRVPQTFERVQSVDGSDIQANLVDGFIVHQCQQWLQHVRSVPSSTFNQQSLSVQSPHKRRVLQCLDKLFAGSVGETAEVVNDIAVVSCRDNSINPTVFLVAQIAFVGVAFASFESLWCWIVLHDVVVPVQNPDGSIGANFGHDRSTPFVVTGQKVDRAGGCVVGTVTAQHERANKMAGGPADERRFVPPLLWKCASRVQCVPCPGRVAAELIDLPYVFRDGLEQISVCNTSQS